MDEIDRAQERTEQFIAASLSQQSLAATLPQPTGFCFNCQDPVQSEERWCNCDCRADWQQRQLNKSRR